MVRTARSHNKQNKNENGYDTRIIFNNPRHIKNPDLRCCSTGRNRGASEVGVFGGGAEWTRRKDTKEKCLQ